MAPKICVIIPSYNLTTHLKTCLKALKRTHYDNLIIILFDNGSNPPLIKSLISFKTKFKKMVFLRSDKNLGFAQANNICLKYGLKNFPQTDYFLLLNNDAYIRNNFFNQSIPYLKQKPHLASPIIELTNRRGIDSMGIDYYSDGMAINRKKGGNISCLLPAASLFVSKEFVQECINKFSWLFIPIFGSYVEDTELSLRALMMNKKIILVNKKLVYHEKSVTFNDNDLMLYLSLRNQLWTIIITWTKIMIYKHLFEVLQGQIVNNIIYFLKFKRPFMFEIYWHTIINLSQLLRLRKIVQKNLIIDYPNNVFLKNPITFKRHILRSRTYKKIINSLDNLL